MTRTFLALWALFLPTSALANDEEPLHITFSLNVGTFGVVASEDGWEAQYIYYGPGINIPLSRRVVLMPSLAFETAPETGAWGLAGTCTLEVLLSKHFGLDFVPSVIQDTTDGDTEFIIAAGPGFTYISSHHVGVGVIAQGSYMLEKRQLAFLPSFNISVPIP